MGIFEIATVLAGLAVQFGYLNHRYLYAPPTIGAGAMHFCTPVFVGRPIGNL